ncbi:uncharacterized protein LOC110841839 [Folsomia candida]|uniref:Uncharacterized protein n=1 Tax=Folsomia candida TaxID=158441 RepID=A0A226F1K5_FOLCA|nr:uncharacterized protein LOC110841839 [Folsomia candida]OXA63659.1 hypothetical protein Fcan01_01107 [Folsomia candida]
MGASNSSIVVRNRSSHKIHARCDQSAESGYFQPGQELRMGIGPDGVKQVHVKMFDSADTVINEWTHQENITGGRSWYIDAREDNLIGCLTFEKVGYDLPWWIQQKTFSWIRVITLKMSPPVAPPTATSWSATSMEQGLLYPKGGVYVPFRPNEVDATILEFAERLGCSDGACYYQGSLRSKGIIKERCVSNYGKLIILAHCSFKAPFGMKSKIGGGSNILSPADVIEKLCYDLGVDWVKGNVERIYLVGCYTGGFSLSGGPPSASFALNFVNEWKSRFTFHPVLLVAYCRAVAIDGNGKVLLEKVKIDRSDPTEPIRDVGKYEGRPQDYVLLLESGVKSEICYA